jgi:TPP-dependent pyruvate/acetoin dehydrogenase alpha subunit
MHRVVLRAISYVWFDASDAARQQVVAALAKAAKEPNVPLTSDAARQQVVAALAKAAKEPKAPLDAMFADVYATLPWHLAEQRDEVAAHVARHPGACPDIPAK